MARVRPEDIQDLHAHLKGGIPNRDLDALQPYWDAFPSLRSTLFKPLRDGYSQLAVAKADISSTVTGSTEYEAFETSTNGIVKHWWNTHAELLVDIKLTTRPAEVIADLGETLLHAFRSRPLIDEYGVYEQLMSYWNDLMHDDVTLVMSEGWESAAKPRKTIEDKERKLAETPDLMVGAGRSAAKWKMDLIPPALVVDRYFAKEKAELDVLIAVAEVASQAIEEFVEENSGEDGLLADAMDDEKSSKALGATRLRVAKREDPRSDEVKALTELIALYHAEAAAKKASKDAQAKLNDATLKQYGRLTSSEIQSLVVDDKWGGRMVSGVTAELGTLTQKLVDRLNVLGERYEKTVGDLDVEVKALSAKVAAHLAAMGVER